MNMNLSERITTHELISNELSQLSDQHLQELISQATPSGKGIGGTTATMELCGAQIFVKRIRLTDIERQPENFMSTANLFKLLPNCQFGLAGIGTPGFGAWREVRANQICTAWVLRNECLHFPIMYHWRVLSKSIPLQPTSQELHEIEESVQYWEGSPAVRERLEAQQKASAEVLLFMEYIPWTLREWFIQQIACGDTTAASAATKIAKELNKTTSFMKYRGFLHFDAHFNNILTDGTHLYFSDFGLAIASQFDLSETEIKFFEYHRDYDQYYTVNQLIHWLVVTLFGTENCISVIEEYITGNENRTIDPLIASIIRRHAPVAKVMKNFFLKFQTESRTTLFPVTELEKASKCMSMEKQL